MQALSAWAVEAILTGKDYRTQVRADGAIGYWRLGETSGVTAADSSVGGAHPGTYTGGVTLSQTALQPDGNLAALFDGTTGYVNVPDAIDLRITGSITLEAWVKFTDISTSYGFIISKSNGGFGGYELFRHDLTGRFRFSGYNATGLIGFDYLTTASFNDGVWHHIVGTFDGTTAVIYVDGVSVAIGANLAGTPGGLVASTEQLCIGKRAFADGHVAFCFHGTIDEPAVYAMALTAAQIKIHYLCGHWTALTADVLLGNTPLAFSYGISGSTPMNRVADIGQLAFTLDNSAHNSAKLLGYYSPLHANCRSGFTFGMAVRVSFTLAGTTYYKWRGKVVTIEPVPGLHQARETLVAAVDWMADAGDYSVYEVSAQLNQRDDQVFNAVLATMPKQPPATAIQTGLDTYTYALDDLGDHPYLPTVFQKIAQSSLSYVYLKGDTTQGGTLVYEIRSARPLAGPTNTFTFSNDMVGVSVPRTLDMLFNRVETVVHPRKIDAAATTVLWTNSTGQPIVIDGNSSLTIWANYFDPTQQLSLIGGTSLVAPVAMTDYVANSASDGSGANLTANITVTMTAFAATVKLGITNAGGATTYLTLLQLRGKGIYDYAPVQSRAESASSQQDNGLKLLDFDMPYQNLSDNGQQTANLFLTLYAQAITHVAQVKFFASNTSALLTAALSLEIGARIGVVETVTGVTDVIPASSAMRGFYIQKIDFEVVPSRIGPLVICTWDFTPADSQAYWILDHVGASELDVTTVLGFL